MRRHSAPAEIEFRRSPRSALRAPNRSGLHGVTRLAIPPRPTRSRAARALTIGANVIAAILVAIGAVVAPSIPLPGTVLCITGALLIFDVTGFFRVAMPARGRCEVVDLARARRSRTRAPVT